MRILDQVSGGVSPPAWHGRANWPSDNSASPSEPLPDYSSFDHTSRPEQDPGPVDSNETQPPRNAADKPRDPIVKALRWLWWEIVKSFADYAEVMYPSFADPGDPFEHPPRQTDFRANDPHPAEMPRAIDVSPWSQPLPAKHRAGTRSSAPGFWARRRARRAMRAMMATLEFPDGRR